MIVDLLPSDEQRMIEESVQGFLMDRLPVERLRNEQARGGAAERDCWDDIIGLGLFGLGLPEARGGLGLGLPEETLVARALGRHLVSPSILAQIVAPHLTEDDATIASLIAGQGRAAFASEYGHIIDSKDATHIVILSASGAELIAAPILAGTNDIALIDETVSSVRIGQGAKPTHDRMRPSLLISAYLIGIAQATTAMAVEYAKTREQFGQAIGAFQAIKHMCADMATRAAAAEAQAFFAAATFGRGLDDSMEIAAARVLSADAALANAKANIQIHGGMGFTAECDAHLFLKRAHLLAWFGSNRGLERRNVLGD